MTYPWISAKILVRAKLEACENSIFESGRDQAGSDWNTKAFCNSKNSDFGLPQIFRIGLSKPVGGLWDTENHEIPRNFGFLQIFRVFRDVSCFPGTLEHSTISKRTQQVPDSQQSRDSWEFRGFSKMLVYRGIWNFRRIPRESSSVEEFHAITRFSVTERKFSVAEQVTMRCVVQSCFRRSCAR